MAKQAQLEKDFAGRLGETEVSTDHEILQGFERCLSPVPDGKPLMIVRPRSAEEIRGVIKAANKTKVNLVPSASGLPRFRGGTIPSGDGVIVDLSGMRRIINLDRRNKAAIIEPGVTFGQLKAEAEKIGLKVLMPLLPKANKSVLATTSSGSR